MATTYTLISSNVLSGSAASVTFSSIPSTYTDLVLRASIRTNNASTDAVLSYSINNDNTTLYSSTRLLGDGSAASSNRVSGVDPTGTRVSVVNGSTSTANTFAPIDLYIPNYTSTTAKQIGTFGAQENNTAAASLTATAQLYRGTSAVTRIDMICGNTSNFVSGSSFYLYGIKNS